MFNGERYITRGINNSVSIGTQSILWQLIDKLKSSKGIEVDYLQVFKLKKKTINGVELQSIVQTQEVPKYNKELLFICDEIVEEKIFVIDSGNYSTMMLAEEY